MRHTDSNKMGTSPHFASHSHSTSNQTSREAHKQPIPYKQIDYFK